MHTHAGVLLAGVTQGIIVGEVHAATSKSFCNMMTRPVWFLSVKTTSNMLLVLFVRLYVSVFLIMDEIVFQSVNGLVMVRPMYLSGNRNKNETDTHTRINEKKQTNEDTHIAFGPILHVHNHSILYNS